MALQLDRTSKGILCNYWKIIKTSNDVKGGQTTIRLALYKDQAARDDDVNNYFETEAFTFTGDDLDRAALYAKVKEPVNEEQEDPNDPTQTITVQINVFVDATDV